MSRSRTPRGWDWPPHRIFLPDEARRWIKLPPAPDGYVYCFCENPATGRFCHCWEAVWPPKITIDEKLLNPSPEGRAANKNKKFPHKTYARGPFLRVLKSGSAGRLKGQIAHRPNVGRYVQTRLLAQQLPS